MTKAVSSHRKEVLNYPLTKLEWGRQEGGGGNNQRREILKARLLSHTHCSSIHLEAIYMKTITCLPSLVDEVRGTYYLHPVLSPHSELPSGIPQESKSVLWGPQAWPYAEVTSL